MCFVKKQFTLSVLTQSYIGFIKDPFLKLQDLVKTALPLPEEVLCAAVEVEEERGGKSIQGFLIIP